jgi:hypothetical protein
VKFGWRILLYDAGEASFANVLDRHNGCAAELQNVEATLLSLCSVQNGEK